MLHTVLLVIHIIASFFLIFIILIQSGKGEGLADVFGGGSSQTTIFGSRTGNFLTKATTASAIIFMITCLSLAFMSKKKGASVITQELIKKQTVEKVQQMIDPEQESENAQIQEVAKEQSEAMQTEASEQPTTE